MSLNIFKSVQSKGTEIKYLESDADHRKAPVITISPTNKYCQAPGSTADLADTEHMIAKNPPTWRLDNWFTAGS